MCNRRERCTSTPGQPQAAHDAQVGQRVLHTLVQGGGQGDQNTRASPKGHRRWRRRLPEALQGAEPVCRFGQRRRLAAVLTPATSQPHQQARAHRPHRREFCDCRPSPSVQANPPTHPSTPRAHPPTRTYKIVRAGVPDAKTQQTNWLSVALVFFSPVRVRARACVSTLLPRQEDSSRRARPTATRPSTPSMSITRADGQRLYVGLKKASLVSIEGWPAFACGADDCCRGPGGRGRALGQACHARNAGAHAVISL